MSYPGDTNLSAAIQERVQNTYAQSRELALKGKTQEASLGCEFVLRLDPLFAPARELMDQLESGVPIGPEEPAAAAPAAAADPDFDLAGELASLLEVRDFRTLLSVANDHAERIAGDSALAEMVAAAQERLEAEPYVRSFIESAEKAQRQGRQDEALALLEKARALDPSHPSLPTATYKPAQDESNDRIRELLDEGQRSLDRNDYQGAIDSWSRIFLIDIDHMEATRRIENARRLKAENERKIEESFHEGVSLWEIGTTDKAREQFERVLALDASHSGARDYLERMEAREALDTSDFGGAEPSGDAEIFAPPDPGTARAPQPEFGDEELPDLEELGAAPPAPRRGAPAKAAPAAKPSRLGSRRFLMIGGLVVVLLGVAFAALYLKRDAFFPNSDEPGAAAPVDVLVRARQLHDSGQTVMATAQLKRLTPDHPQYAEAQALIAQWEAPPEPVEPAGPSAEDLARRDALVALAQEARQAQEYLRASTYYERAAQLAPLGEEDQLLQAEVEQRLAGLETEIELFRQGDWDFVLPGLWKLHAANPDDRDVVRLMVDSYFNLGVRDLQRGDTAEAAEKFTRARELDPDDAEVARLLRFSEVYGSRPADLLYRIFVKYLRFR